MSSFSSNWNIIFGSLSSSISVESSDLTIEEEYKTHENPIVLTPNSKDSEPCQITISFTHRQEVRQVYVRSTARVYEIYSGRSRVSSNDYLCTVRCGIATRDDEVLHPTDVEPVDALSKESLGEQVKENCSSSEDDWVKVKVLDMPSQDGRHNLACEKNSLNPQSNLQDLYEATAEFTDSDACTSLTLRLLSLQTKDWINIDEIYVFADPAESGDSEAQTAPVGNPATTSLMSMLVPTLLQLSKSSNAQRQDRLVPNSSGKREYLDISSKVKCSTDLENEFEQENIEAVTKPPEVHIPEEEAGTGQRSNGVAQTDVLTNRVESVLDQLVSRVSRIEDICLRFEENMLNPIRSMEQRLQLVEEQVQVLVKNSQNSMLPSYTRISAPEFSCGESNSSSFYTEGNENQSIGEVELKKKDTTSDKLPNSSSTKFHPALVITPLEFSCHDDEVYNDGDNEAKDGVTGPFNDCLQEKPRQALSIDDALAAALFGFMANAGVQPAHYTQALTVKAPEFTIEETSDDDMPTEQNGNTLVTRIFCSESNGTECNNSIVLTSPEENNGLDKLVIDCINCSKSETEPELTHTDDSQIGNSIGVGKPSDEITEPVSVKDDILDAVSENTEVDVRKRILGNAINLAENRESQNADSTGLGEHNDETTISVSGKSETVEECSDNNDVESEKSISENSFDIPWASCPVDFELPILDVKFTSSEFPSSKSSLEALFDNISEFVVVASSMEQKNEVESVPNNPSTCNKLLLDWEVNDASYGPSSLEGEALDDSLACNKQDSFPILF